MDLINAILDFLKYMASLMAGIIVIKLVLDSGFSLDLFKIKSKNFNIEISGHEKNAQPDQK